MKRKSEKSLVHFHLLCVIALAVTALLARTDGAAQAGTSCPQTYIVREGDTLAALAQRLGVSENVLLGLNRGHIGRNGALRPKQALCVPSVAGPLASLEVEYQYMPDPEFEEGQMLSRD